MKIPQKNLKIQIFLLGQQENLMVGLLKKLNTKYLGRYHRSEDVREYVEKIILNIKKTLKIPKDYKIFFLPGSSTGAMTSVMNSILGKKELPQLYDYWGLLWSEELKN